jgi:hypothetical protein
MMARKSGEMQAIGPIFDEINRRVADAIGEAVQKGADPQAAIGAAVITASDFAVLMFGRGSVGRFESDAGNAAGQGAAENWRLNRGRLPAYIRPDNRPRSHPRAGQKKMAQRA